jgi:hypothetical protein
MFTEMVLSTGEEMNSWWTVSYKPNKGTPAFMMSHTAITHLQHWHWVILVDIMVKGTTTNSDVYVTTLQSLVSHIQWKENVLLLHNTRPYTSPRTVEIIKKGWTVLRQTPHQIWLYHIAIFLVHWRMPFMDESLRWQWGYGRSENMPPTDPTKLLQARNIGP